MYKQNDSIKKKAIESFKQINNEKETLKNIRNDIGNQKKILDELTNKIKNHEFDCADSSQSLEEQVRKDFEKIILLYRQNRESMIKVSKTKENIIKTLQQCKDTNKNIKKKRKRCTKMLDRLMKDLLNDFWQAS